MLQCWINASYQNERLYLHYLWIFVCMFGTIIVYSLIYFSLRRKSSQPRHLFPSAHHPLPIVSQAVTPLMLLYPIIYIICTIPLAAGRIASMAGRKVSLEYFCVAGAMIACNGWLDVLLYSITRRGIVFSDTPPNNDDGIDTFWGLGYARPHGMGNVTTIEAGGNTTDSENRTQNKNLKRGHTASTENLYGISISQSTGALSGIKTETTINVSREAVPDHGEFEMQARSKLESQGRSDKESWDARSGRSFDD
jgi:hypothetical protein